MSPMSETTLQMFCILKHFFACSLHTPRQVSLPPFKTQMAVGQNQWYHFGVGEFTSLYSILVVGLGCSLGGSRDFDPWPGEQTQKRPPQVTPEEEDLQVGNHVGGWTGMDGRCATCPGGRKTRAPLSVPQLGALSHRFFFGWEGSPTKIDYRKKQVPLF